MRFYKRRADIVCDIYIYCKKSRGTCMELFQQRLAPLVLKFGIRQEQAGRNGLRRGEEEGMSRGAESQYS
jgi:hypothetical protein